MSLKKIAAWFLPYHCLICGDTTQRSQDICDACYTELPILTQACTRCAKHLPETRGSLICGDCLSHSPAFDVTHALYVYQAPVTSLILNLKFSEALVNARLLGELLAEKIQQEWYQYKPLPEMIIPVPLHPKRLRERGFNQALELARPLAKRLHLPINTQVCQRIKYTPPQATLTATERTQNIKNAFQLNENVKGKHIALLDDVITTGNTIAELSLTFKLAGAHKIDVWCCARAVKR